MSNAALSEQVLSTLLPYLKTAGNYAAQVQSQINEQPDKAEMPNFFAAALSDADLSVQTFVEVALLSHFPTLRFFGEEYEKSYNTKYFSSIDLGRDEELLVTLDPIDGTRFYLDDHPNFQIILTVLNRQGYEGVVALSPAKREFFYALNGKGTCRGNWEASLEDCVPMMLKSVPNRPALLLGFAMQSWSSALAADFEVIQVAEDYSPTEAIPNVNGILTGELAGAILAAGNWIDGGAIAFLVQEAGGVVTDLKGESLPPLHLCQDRRFSGMIIAASAEIHEQILKNRMSANLMH